MSNTTFGAASMAGGTRIDDGGFFSSIKDWTGLIGNVAGAIGSAINPQPSPVNSGPPLLPQQPTYSGPAPTTGTPSNDQKPVNYMPYLLVGGAILVAVVLLRK